MLKCETFRGRMETTRRKTSTKETLSREEIEEIMLPVNVTLATWRRKFSVDVVPLRFITADSLRQGARLV